MSDIQLCELIAQIWVDNGGDAEGLDYCYQLLKKSIETLQTKQPS